MTLQGEGTPLPGVTVSIDELGLTSITDVDGRYALTLPASRRGQVKVTASLQGFQSKSVNVDASGNATQDFVLRPSFGQEITVGSRAINAEQEKAVPVDVIPREQIETSPSTETNQIIEKIAPSFNFPRPTITDGTDNVRPATLRGLGPDQVLVMVNGKRRHVSALVNVNSTVGRGSAGVDLNAIPASAIDNIEILRDGAAAQYGSDAIAGVLNIVLKSDAQPLKLDVKGGSTTHSDGQMIDTNLSGGWKIARGALFGTVEYRDRYATNRATADPRPQLTLTDAGNNPVRQPNTHWGDAYERDIMSLLNLNLPISEDAKNIFYAFGTYGLRHGSHGGNYRRAIDATDWPQIYPLGFLPLIEPRISDQALNAGVRGELAKWFYDASAGYGRNKFDFYVRNSLNVSLGPAIPPNQTSFYAGSLGDKQYTANLDLSRGFNVGLAGPINVAAGAEYRREGYSISAGEPNSYIDGGVLNQAAPKLRRARRCSPASVPRTSWMFRATARLSMSTRKATSCSSCASAWPGDMRTSAISAAPRTGRLRCATRRTKPLIFRAAASTGFRAPSLGQSWFSTVSTNFLRDSSGNVVPFEVWTAPVSSPIAVALGAKPLRPETSKNLSGGAVWQPMSNLEMTADFFHIDIKHRIVLSGNFTGTQVAPLLAPFGASAARFFTNAIDTRTNGYDLVVNHQRPIFNGRIDLSAAYSNNKTKIVRIEDTPPQLAGLGETLFDRGERHRAECGQPRDNARVMESYSQGPWNITSRQARYGEFCSFSILTKDDQTYPATWLTDLEMSYRWSKYIFAIGAENLFDSFPQKNLGAGTPNASVMVGSAGAFTYPTNSPFGMNGRFVYTRVGYTF